MKKQKKTSNNLIREVINLLVKFFKSYGLSHEMINIPKNLKFMGYKVGLMSLGITVVTLIFSFMLKATNTLIEYRFILLGIILFMLYRGQEIVRQSFILFEQSEGEKFSLIFDDEIVFRGSQIIGKTANRVLKYDEQNQLYMLMSNESVLNTIKNYLKNFWQLKVQHIFDLCEMISIIIMLVAAIITNTSIKQIIFIPMIFAFVAISFFSSAYISMNREVFYKMHKKFNNEQSIIVNDLLRVPAIVNADLEMRINKFQKTVIESNKNVVNFHKKLNISRLVVTIIETFSQYGIIIVYLLGVEWNSIDLATITQITATLLIVETALSQIRSIVTVLERHNDRLVTIESEEKDLSLILNVYNTESKKTSTAKRVDEIEIKPFSIRYLEESENDRPFSLISNKIIKIRSGEIAILYGPSGSGKSTFMKMLTERIRLEKSTDIPATSRFLFYDEKLRFGSLCIFEELFCCEENPDLAKMQNILENMHLWHEIKANCIDVWKWMKEKQYESLSNGQKQRLIIAKMLYWLDDNIDVMVLDECTSGLDDKSELSDVADAEKILEYIVRFANSDRKRIVIISTHQNIDGFKQRIAKECTAIRNLQFVKEGELNIVKEI